MKKFFLAMLFAGVLPYAALAQAPQALNYQAVARNASGAVLANQSLSVRLAVINNSASGPTLYQETHTGVSTNQFGLFTLAVGSGTPNTGMFQSIDWANGAKFLKVEVDFGSGFITMGTSQLLSVPYALFAGSAANDNDNQTLSVSGNQLSISAGNSVTLPTGAQNIDDLNDVITTGASNGQILQWNGSNWVPATVTGGIGDNWGSQTVIANSPLTGNGVAGNPLKLQDGTASGQVLRWNGTAWVASTVTDNDNQTLSINGSSLTISNGNTITLPGGSDSQTLSISGSTLTISNGNSVTLPSGTAYSAGTGISITGNVISNTGDGDNSSTNEIQTLSLSGTTLSLSNGGGSVTLPSGGGGIAGSGTTNYLAKFTPNGTTVGNSLFQDNGTNIGINSAPNATDRMVLTPGSLTGGLFVNHTNAANGSYGLRVSSTVAGTPQAHLGYSGTVGFGSLTATNPAVYGASASGVSPGVLAVNSGTNTSAASVGLSNNWHGGFFSTNDTDGSGVVGTYAGTTASGSGVVGIYTGTADFGVGAVGFNLNTSSTQAIGVEGGYDPAAYGIGVAGIGWSGAYPAASQDIGVYGSSLIGVYGEGVYGLYSEGDFAATGLKSASVPTTQGNQLVYCMESPEVWFEDFGRGTLVNGEVTITLDPLFLETVHISDEHPMMITVTPLGDCKGLYVVPGTTSFTVRELGGGTANVGFTYRLSCKRNNYQDHRFGADLVRNANTREVNHYIAPRPVNYSEAVRQTGFGLKTQVDDRAVRFRRQAAITRN